MKLKVRCTRGVRRLRCAAGWRADRRRLEPLQTMDQDLRHAPRLPPCLCCRAASGVSLSSLFAPLWTA